MLFYLVNAVIIGYMAGALNNGSTNFKRMLGAGLTAAIITAVIQVFMNYNFALDFAGASSTSVLEYSPRINGSWTLDRHITRRSRTVRIRVSLRTKHCFRRNRANYCKSNDVVWAFSQEALIKSPSSFFFSFMLPKTLAR